MAVFKCKMCGGDLEILDNATICECEYCGTKQTIPTADDEKKLTLFNRANKLRFNNEFDKAAGIYESIVSEFPEEAESYWGLVLCKYGIEYVDDKKTAKKIPTCHRTVPSTVLEDENFIKAIECADTKAKTVYKAEARAIDKLQKQILKIVEAEEPYDVFICYKEADRNGQRTEDSAIAQDIYTELVKEGYRVFFSRVTLRDKAGTDYEPYIYSALSSAKVMLTIGTKEEYYDAVWVKNEWGRYLSMMADDKSKHLIPCYKDLDAYDIPNEFKNLQALNMGDVTFFKSLFANIKKYVKKKAEKEAVAFNSDNPDVAPLLERGFLFLEDNEWERADEFFEAVLNKEPKNGNAYLGKLLVDLKIASFEDLSSFYAPFSDNSYYAKIMRFADDELKESVKKCNDIIVRRNEEARKKEIYQTALQIMENATTEELFDNAGYLFLEIKDFSDAKIKSDECFKKAGIAEKDTILSDAKSKMTGDDILTYQSAITLFESIPGWKDADEQIAVCRQRIEKIKIQRRAERIERERERFERERKAEENWEWLKKQKKKEKKRVVGIVSGLVAITLLVMLLVAVITPNA